MIEGRDSCTCARCGAALPIADLNAFTIAMRSHSGTIVRTVRERGRDIHITWTRRSRNEPLYRYEPEDAMEQRFIPTPVLAVLVVGGVLAFLALLLWANQAG